MAESSGSRASCTRAPVDQGYSWVICIGVAVMFFVVSGVTKSLGVMQLEFQEYYGSDPGLTSLTVALVAAGFFTFVFVSNSLGMLIGYRVVALCGAVVAILSMLATAYSPNIYCVIVFLGMFSGIGYSAMYGPPLIILSSYFKRRRGLATSIGLAGGSVGHLCLPLLINYLINEFGYHGGMLLITGILLHTIPAGMLLRPHGWWTGRHLASATDDSPRPPFCTQLVKVLKVMGNKKLVASPVFLMFAVCIILGHMGYFAALIFLPSAAKSFFGNQTIAVTLISVIGVCDFIGRLLGGFVTDLHFVSITDIMGIDLLVSGVVTVIMGIYPTVWLIYVSAVVIGLFTGSYSSLVTPAIIELFGVTNLSPGFGILTLLMGVFITPWPTALAHISKLTGTFKTVMILSGVFSIAAGLGFLLLKFIVRKREPIQSELIMDNIGEKSNSQERIECQEKTDSVNELSESGVREQSSDFMDSIPEELCWSGSGRSSPDVVDV